MSVSAADPVVGPRASMTLGHPTGLTFLFLTGMWETAALFGMRTILVFYLVHQIHFSSASAVKIYGLATALTFLMSLLGGVIADRCVGMRRAVFAGALLLAGGHFLLMAPPLLFPSLVLIGVGAGLFRPALVALVLTLYEGNDPRKPRALLLYKLGCNIGGILGPIVCGFLYEVRGWTSAVGFCGAGMLISIGIFACAQPFLTPGESSTKEPGKPLESDASPESPGLRALLRPGMVLSAIGFGAILHWTVASQQGGSMALWTYESLNRTVHVGSRAFLIPAAWFQTLNPILIMILTPAVAKLWSRGSSSASTEMRRMVLGSVLLAAAFAILSAVEALHSAGPVSWVWLALMMVPLTLGEMYIDPMGQSVFSRLAPQGLLTTVISIWFVTLAAGHVAAGWLGALWETLSPPWFFALCTALSLLSAAVLHASKRLWPEPHR